jgi:hypothetical protein
MRVVSTATISRAAACLANTNDGNNNKTRTDPRSCQQPTIDKDGAAAGGGGGSNDDSVTAPGVAPAAATANSQTGRTTDGSQQGAIVLVANDGMSTTAASKEEDDSVTDPCGALATAAANSQT